MTNFNAQVLAQSSWRGIAPAESADAMIERAEKTGAWPIAISRETLTTSSGLVAPGEAVVAEYASGSRKAVGVRSPRYRATTPEQWREIVRAAVAAGGCPMGAFAMKKGSRVLALFEVGETNGIRTALYLADGFDGTLALTAGFSTVRVPCANQLAGAMARDGQRWATVRHDGSLAENARALGGAIAAAIESGQTVRETYARAARRRLTSAERELVLDALYPVPSEDESPIAHARALKVREDAQKAAARPENDEGDTLASIWNAATWLVDRTAEGEAKRTRASEPLESMLFGSRGRRIEEVRHLIEVVLCDGTTAMVEASVAKAHGIDDAQIGRALLPSMLAS
jgi:hypothetical protein